MSNVMLGARISHVLTPGAEKLDELFGKILGSAGSVSQGALPFRCAPGESSVKVGAGSTGEVSFRGRYLHITASGVQGQLASRNHKKLNKFIEAWAKSRGWLGADGSLWELSGYLNPDRMAIAIWGKYINNLASIPIAGGKMYDPNVTATIKITELTKLADKLYVERSAGWIKVHDYFTPTTAGGLSEAGLIADAFESVAFELPDMVWQCFAEFVISNGRWVGFEEAVNMVAGSVGQ